MVIEFIVTIDFFMLKKKLNSQLIGYFESLQCCWIMVLCYFKKFTKCTYICYTASDEKKNSYTAKFKINNKISWLLS